MAGGGGLRRRAPRRLRPALDRGPGPRPRDRAPGGRRAGTPGRLRDAVGFLAGTPARPTDLGRVEAEDGTVRTFLNSASVGLAAAVAERAARSRTPLGRAAYAGAAARELLTCRAGRYRVALDDAPIRPRLLLNFTVLNSRRFGGGIPLAPPADPGDGRLDAVLIGPLGPLGIADAVGRLVRGTPLDHPTDPPGPDRTARPGRRDAPRTRRRASARPRRRHRVRDPGRRSHPTTAGGRVHSVRRVAFPSGSLLRAGPRRADS